MMTWSIILASMLMGSGLGEPTTEELATYEAARVQAGNDADAHVRLALWSELRGLDGLRSEELHRAIEIKPDHPTARRLQGQILDKSGEWLTPTEAVNRAKAEVDRADALARYGIRRESIADTPQAHWQLAVWSDEAGLVAEARVHYRAVVRLDPAREEAWKKLGARKQAGQWVIPDRLAAEKTDAEARRKAESHWRPLLVKWKTWLKQTTRQAEVEAAFREMTDPMAVGSIVKVFGPGGPEDLAMASRLLGQVDAPSAARGLAWLAVFGSTDAVRQSAVEALAGRDPRECSGWLIAQLRNPIKYEVKPVGGPGSPGELYIEGKRLNTRNFYSAPAPMLDFRPGDTLAYDAYGYLVVRRMVGYAAMPLGAAIDPLYQGAPDLTGLGPILEQGGLGASGVQLGKQMAQNQKNNTNLGNTIGRVGRSSSSSFNMPIQADIPLEQMMRQAQEQAALARQALNQDVASLESYNADVKQRNHRVVAALKTLTGEAREPNFDAWRKWWGELEETSTITPLPTRLADLDEETVLLPTKLGSKSRLPALGKGTPVWTERGVRPIEEIRSGDLVLTQDPTSGSLAFTPVWSIRRLEPGLVRSLRFKDASLVATDLERFWIAGRGWVLLGNIQAGDPIRTLQGLARVVAVEEPKAEPAFHIQVGDGRAIFVGEKGMMAHDDQVNHPVAVPFDLSSLPSTSRPRRPD
jgi:hypothetical protein